MVVALALVGVLTTPAGAFAQQADADRADAGRFRFGPLRFTPSIALTSIGIDSNVFNDAGNPQQDTTAAIGPAVDLWLHGGRSRLTGKVSGQYLYFDRFSSQRAFNTVDQVRWELPMTRLTPFFIGNYANTKERPGFEIDSRARQTSEDVGVGTEIRLSGQTSVVLTGTRARVAFDPTETFLGVDLANALNHTSDTVEVQFREKHSALTTFVVSADEVQDRFAFDPLRDANSLKVLPGFELKPSALVSGTVFVGYRRFEPLGAAVPSYQGLVASVDARYTASATLLALKLGRDLTYSFEPTEPYYTLTDAMLSVTQRITYAWDLVGRAGRQTLDYHGVTPGSASNASFPAAHVDTISQYGAGVGYRIGRTLRIGFDGNYLRRRSSDLSQRDYQGVRMGASISYGLPQ